MQLEYGGKFTTIGDECEIDVVLYIPSFRIGRWDLSDTLMEDLKS